MSFIFRPVIYEYILVQPTFAKLSFPIYRYTYLKRKQFVNKYCLNLTFICFKTNFALYIYYFIYTTYYYNIILPRYPPHKPLINSIYGRSIYINMRTAQPPTAAVAIEIAVAAILYVILIWTIRIRQLILLASPLGDVY